MIRRGSTMRERAVAQTIPLFLCAAFVCFLTAPASASSGSERDLLYDGLPTIADLDGDHIPDAANSTKAARTELGYSYRIDFRFGNGAAASPLTVLSDEGTGLNIEAIDVDGDHDLDLVITTRLLHRPVALWLNNGRGRFTRGDPAQFSSAFRFNTCSVDATSDPNPRVISFQRRRPEIAALNPGSVIDVTVYSPSTTAWMSFVLLPTGHAVSVCSRAPPIVAAGFSPR